MNFKLLIAPPDSNNFIQYDPDQTIHNEISMLFLKKMKDPNSIEIKLNNMSILMMDTTDESNYKTGYIVENGLVIYKLRWTELYPEIDIDKLKLFLHDKKYIKVPDWKLYWIADLQNELVRKYIQYVNGNDEVKARLGKRIMLIRYELSLLYTPLE